jgi:hypothetical protein
MKYYRIMELECCTKINNRGVGADFFNCTETEVDSTIKAIEIRKNNYDIEAITEQEYIEEVERTKRKNLRLVCG